ncbi:MAG: acetyltransferase [Bacteroidota bacterium]|nr:acetyltransferase [Bacteroidota bacterium]
MKTGYCIYGASGHSKVIIEILEKSDFRINCLYDDDPKKKLLFEYSVSNQRSILTLPNVSWIIGIGNNIARKKIAKNNLLDYGIAIDKSANISKRTIIGKGTVIMPGVTINTSTIIGNHVIVNTNASIDHDCILGDYSHISPNATLCGGVSVGEGTHIGAGATIIPGIKIGKWAKIGAGCVIIKDVPDYVTLVGNPGKVIKLIKENER